MYFYLCFVLISLAPCLCEEGKSEVNKSLRAPSNLELTASHAAVEVTWDKLQDDAANPILGYKVILCEVSGHVIYKYESAEDSSVLVQETRPADPFEDLQDTEDQKEKKKCKEIVTAATEARATFEAPRVETTYEARVRAVGGAGEGPPSDPVTATVDANGAAEHAANEVYIVTN